MLRAADANPGGMAAVIGLDDAVVEALCAEQDGVWPANFNCPGQVVISGRKPALEMVAAKAREAGAKRVLALAVSGAFHSPLVESALEPLREEFERTAWHAPDPAFFSGCSVRFETDHFDELLQVQLISPVRFRQSVSSLLQRDMIRSWRSARALCSPAWSSASSRRRRPLGSPTWRR